MRLGILLAGKCLAKKDKNLCLKCIKQPFPVQFKNSHETPQKSFLNNTVGEPEKIPVFSIEFAMLHGHRSIQHTCSTSQPSDFLFQQNVNKNTTPLILNFHNLEHSRRSLNEGQGQLQDYYNIHLTVLSCEVFYFNNKFLISNV